MDWRCRKMARPIDLDQLMKYPLRRGSEHCDEKNADPRFLNGVESILEWAQTLPTLTPPNEWVSVEDRLPASGQNVIATNGSYVGEAWYASLSRSWYRYNGLEWDRICREVTHWMPLPKSPKEDE
jgi:hypothetical protein